jgi:hypothetical protein
MRKIGCLIIFFFEEEDSSLIRDRSNGWSNGSYEFASKNVRVNIYSSDIRKSPPDDLKCDI